MYVSNPAPFLEDYPDRNTNIIEIDTQMLFTESVHVDRREYYSMSSPGPFLAMESKDGTKG